LLVLVSTQIAPQLVRPAPQAHAPALQVFPPTQTVPQAPQSVLLVCVSTHEAPHSV
jgi:hypothetical protein